MARFGWIGWRRLRHRASAFAGYGFIAVAIYVAGCQLGIELSDQSDGEGGLPWRAILELFAVVGGVGGSWIVARHATRQHARSAFRRLVNLYVGVSEIARAAADGGSRGDLTSLRLVEELARVHCRTAADAFEDWSDLVPREMEDFRRKVAEVVTNDA